MEETHRPIVIITAAMNFVPPMHFVHGLSRHPREGRDPAILELLK